MLRLFGFDAMQISERFGQIKKGFRRVFGCWHRELSLPFTRGAETYQTCVTCGARRRFDLDQWTIAGGFYYPRDEIPDRHARTEKENETFTRGRFDDYVEYSP